MSLTKISMLPFPQRLPFEEKCMPTIKLHFCERDTLPDLLESEAQELDITVEQLVKRFIADGMRHRFGAKGEPAIPGETLEDFLVKNGGLKPKS